MSSHLWVRTRTGALRWATEKCPVLARNVTFGKNTTKQVTVDTMNPNLIKLEYAVRGPLVIRAGEIERELAQVSGTTFWMRGRERTCHTYKRSRKHHKYMGTKKAFNEVIKANIGDAHAMGQVPITFIRQVLACIVYPPLLNSKDFPQDVKERAGCLLQACGGCSVGAYSASHGIEMIRRHCAEYIEKRDCLKTNWEDICLASGASDIIKSVIKTMIKDIDGRPPGVMIPIPQYPLYTATLAEFAIEPVRYYLDEDDNWSLGACELERAYTSAQDKINVRAIVVINPGNPTGQVLTRENIMQIMKFATKYNLFVLADEVYQDNVYAEGSKFHSFKKVATEMGAPYSEIEMASFMSVSKGYMGECGLRGGYVELRNMDPEVQAHLYKTISAMLCPTVVGQAALDCVVKPPEIGDPSYAQWMKEKTGVLKSLAERADLIAKTFNSMPGFKCNVVQGAMYAFPQIELPYKAIEAAKKEGKAPDVYYAFKLLESSGICVVPGTGFGQKEGTHHFRTTILPQPEKLTLMLEAFTKFHTEFVAQHKW